jgi:hypothetical protein
MRNSGIGTEGVSSEALSRPEEWSARVVCLHVLPLGNLAAGISDICTSSSVGERSLDTREVVGSNPIWCTIRPCPPLWDRLLGSGFLGATGFDSVAIP